MDKKHEREIAKTAFAYGVATTVVVGSIIVIAKMNKKIDFLEDGVSKLVHYAESLGGSSEAFVEFANQK